MNGRTFLALGGMLLVIGTAVAQTTNGPVEDINRLDKARQEMIINKLIQAQEQIQRALKRMLKDSVPVNGQPLPGDGSYGSDEADGSDESDEEHKWQEMKRKKIAESRARVEMYVKGIASNFLDMADYIEKIDGKVEEQLNSQHGNVNYNLYYNKKPKPHHHHSSEESEEKFNYRKRPSRRGGRQLAVEEEPVVEEQQEEEVKTIDGEEVVQTLPVKGTE
ncbi:uncharacterized protein LOC6031170 [Culex quinquefasciatus]|uniref:uncharacterized protein LOC6031170 n=1 Tax=Culex quinquefasciatus TaxID=7176 RepID=UPI0018E34AC8|nr:uncharacterized protein LOC6031170 [Culex quinquefasciatus]